MKTKIFFLLLAGCLLAGIAWLVHVPTPVQADDVPEKYRETIRTGLEYLVKTQQKDGHWEGAGGKHPVAMTGLVGLALLIEKDNPRVRGGFGGTFPDAKYLANIRKAVDWLIDNSKAGRDGLIFTEHPSETARYMEGHGLATLFLAGALVNEGDDKRRQKLTDVLTRAVKYIVKAQSTQGGWYHTSKVEGHDFDMVLATAIQFQALQAAENAGIPVPGDAISGAHVYMTNVIAKVEEKAKPGQKGVLPAEMAAILACVSPDRAISREGPAHKLHKKQFAYCQAEIPMGRAVKFGRDELTHYYYAQVLIEFDADKWTAYRTTMFDHLQANQNKDGSWPTAEGFGVGPVYATALWCTILQLDKRSHPSVRQLPVVITTTRRPAAWRGLRFAMNFARELES